MTEKEYSQQFIKVERKALCLIEHCPLKMYGGVRVELHEFLTLTLV
jgi:hypothetical protein